MTDLEQFVDTPETAPLPTVGDAGSDLATWLSGADDTSKLKLSMQEGAKVNPAQATRVLQLQTKTGLPKDYLAQHPDEVESQLAGHAFDAEAFRQSSPTFAGWVAQHPDHAAAAREDLTKLNYVEQQLRYIGDAFHRGQDTVELSDLGAAAMNGSITPEQRTRQALLEASLAKPNLTDVTGFFEQIPGQVANQLPIFERSLGGKLQHGAEGIVIGAAAGAAAGAATVNPALPALGASLGAFTGWRYGAAIEAGKLEMHTAYLDYEKLKDASGVPLDRPTIMGLAGIVGAVNGTLEGMTGVEALANKLPGIRSLSRDGIKQLLQTPTARGVLLTYAKQVGDVMLTEGATEALQMFVTKAGGVFGQALKDGGTPLELLGKIFSPENLAQSVQEARAGAQGGGGMAVGLGAPAALADLHEVKRAQTTAQAFENLGSVLADTKLRESLPQTLRTLIDQATKDGPIDTLYVPTEAFNTYFQSKGVDPRQVAQAITGDVESYDQAMATGTDLAIKTADYATKLAPTEHNAFFAREIRPGVAAMNAREADQWIQARLDEEKTQQEGVQAANVFDPIAKIKHDIAGQLQTLGFDPSVIDQYAALFGARYQARAARRGLGENPFALFEQSHLQVQRQIPEILATLGTHTTELDSFLDRLRSNDLPTERQIYGPSLFDALHERGGLQDQGGEVSALGVDQNRAPFQKNLIQEGGLPLDRAAHAMHEAGYLHEPEIASLLEQLDHEAGGRPVYVPGREDPQLFAQSQQLQELQRYLAEHGVDLQTASNESVKAFLERALQTSAQPATEGETFQQKEPGINAKGQITFGRGRIDITLLERADLSTFIHETGHLYLNELIDDATTPGVPPQLQDDLDSVLKWMGLAVRTANGADAIKAAVGREQHEQFARGFEAYTLEGTSPSQAMREAFARFRQWLIHVYKLMTVRGGVTPASIGEALNVKLTAEVRKVLNRMVATEEEIQSMEQEADVLPMFTDAVAAGMSDQQFANYKDLVTTAGMTAREKLQSQLMAQLARERTEWWKEEREKVKAQVTAETNQHRDYIALAVLQKGTMPDGAALPDGLVAGKLARKAVERVFGKDFLKRLPKGITAKEGVTPDHAASLFGYPSAEELLTSLANARPKKALIEAETDHRMTREYGDPLIDGTLHDKARAAVMNEDREQVIEAELTALQKKQREVAPFIKAAQDEQQQARKGAFSVLMPPLELVRATAKAQILRTAIRELKPHVYFVASQKAGRRSLEALAQDNFVGAAVAKQQELFSLSLYKEATDALEQVDLIVQHLRDLRRKPAQQRLGKAGADYLEQVNGLMEQYELAMIPFVDLDRRQSLRDWIAEKERLGDTLGEEFVVPEAILREARTRNYREVPYEELLGVRDTIKQIEHFAQLKNRLLGKQAAREKAEARDELIAAIQSNTARRKPMSLTDAGMTLGEKASKLAQQFDASLLKTELVVEWLDGGPTGPWHDYLWNPVVDAQAAEHDYSERITAKIAQAVMTIPAETRAHMLDPIQVPGLTQRMVRKDLLGVALNVGNQSNYTKLLKGMGWTHDQVAAMLDQLTEPEWHFVQHVWDTLESMWPDIAALQKTLTGIAPEQVAISPVTTKFGVLKGGYYPLMYSAVLSEQGGLQLSSTFGKLLDDNYIRATLPSGYRKARVQDFARPFDLDVDRLPSHIAGVVKDLTHRAWLLDANWITTDPKIRAVLQQHLGDALTLRLADWVKQVANDRNGPSNRSLSVWQRAIDAFRFNTVIVAMGFKFSTMASQLAGVAPAIETIGGTDGDGTKWFTAGVAETLRRPQSTYDFMTAKSGEMRHRIQTRDRDIRDKLRALEGKTGILAQLQEVSLMGIGYTELLISMPAWVGAYKKALAGGASDEEAVRMGDRAVRLSQGAAGAKDLAAVASRSDSMMRLLTMFYTPFSALYNRLRSIGHDTEGMRDVPRTAVRLFLTVCVAATLGELLAGHGPKGEGDDWLKWWLRTVAIYPFLGVPLLRDAISTVASGYGYQFSPIGQALETSTRLVESTKKAAMGEKEWEDLAGQATKAFSYFLGLPTSQLLITGTYLHDVATGKESPDDLFEFSKKLLYSRPKP